MIRSIRFNIYLCVLLLAVLAVGCKSTGAKEKKLHKKLTILRVHVETKKDPAGRTADVQFPRDQPVRITIDRTPVLTEANVKDAKIVDVMGGFAIWMQFDRRGSWMLEQFTSGNKGKRLAIFATFVPPMGKEPKEPRWLAAPSLASRITDGVISFTPDCTMEEAEYIVQGLKNAAKKYQDSAPNF